MIEKFTFDLQSPKIARKKLILVKEDLETRIHVVLKLLAYLIYYEPRLKVEVSVGMHYKPDLVVEGDHGVPEVWIDCGYVQVKKIESLTQKLKRTKIILLKETKTELENVRRTLDKKLEEGAQLQFLAFDPGFVEGIAAGLQRSNEVTLYEVMENVVGFALNDQVFESHLYFQKQSG